MKKLLFSILITTVTCSFTTASANTYYFSSSNGNDSRTSSQAQNALTPWKTLNKLNSYSFVFVSGDSILLKRGDVFYGKIIPGKSFIEQGNPAIFGTYGTGANPIITGFTTVSKWTSLGGNIWESDSAVSTLATCNMVLINGVNTQMGRYPNSGYLPFQSHSGNTSITSSSLSGSPNWVGAEAVIRSSHWTLDRTTVTTQSGTTLIYSPAITYVPVNGFGFFIQNDPKTLDTLNEWYYNPSTKKIRIYCLDAPTNVQVSTIDTLVKLTYRDNITFNSIDFKGSNKAAFAIISSKNITIQNCNFDFSGYDAISCNRNGGSSSANFIFRNNTVNHTNNNAVATEAEFTNALISNNTFKNTGMLSGMGGSGNGMSIAVQSMSNDAIIEYNKIDSTGYNAISFFNNNAIIRNNYISNFCIVKNDGGGIYTWVGAGKAPYSGQKVLNNIVVNGVGNNAGTIDTAIVQVYGIYLDANTGNVEIAGNTVANCSYGGLFLHNTSNIDVHDNTFYNNGTSILFASNDALNPIRITKSKNNFFISKLTTQKVAVYYTTGNDISRFGIIDSNYLARPIDDSATIQYVVNNYMTSQVGLAGWQIYSGFDINSKKSPRAISNVSQLIFEYNASQFPKAFNLAGTYTDVKNVRYSGIVTLQPYTCLVLIPDETAPIIPSLFTFRSLSAFKKGKNINLKLKVTNDSNIERYEILKSSDGYNFISIGNIKPISNSNIIKDYSWVDFNPTEGNNFYRIRSISNSGDEKYSEIVKVNVSDKAAFISIYPNPVIDKNVTIYIQSTQKGIYYINLINNEGKVLLTKAILHNSGSFNMSVALPQSLPLDIYHLKVTINESSITKSVIIL